MWTQWLLVGVAVAMVVACGLFVAAEFSFVTVRRSYVDQAADQRLPGARGVQAALRGLSTQLSGAQVGITITNLAIGYLAEPSIASLLRGPLTTAGVPSGVVPGISWTIALLLSTGATMLFGELVPKNLAIAEPLAVARRVQRFQRAFTSITKPLTASLNYSANWIVRRIGVEPREELAVTHSPHELASLLEMSVESGSMGFSQARVVVGSLRLDDKLARDVLTPRTMMQAVRADDPVERVIQLARETGYSRFPVLRESPDDVVGVVGLPQAVAVATHERTGRTVASIVSEPLSVPDSLPLDDLLWSLRDNDTQVAVVLDEYGGTAGLVTFEDVLEEVVGEVYDEHDPATRSVRSRPDGSYLVSGLLRPDELRSQTGVSLPGDSDNYDTVAGFVIEQLGKIPEPGDVVDTDGIVLRVFDLDGQRINRLVVSPAAPRGESDE